MDQQRRFLVLCAMCFAALVLMITMIILIIIFQSSDDIVKRETNVTFHKRSNDNNFAVYNKKTLSDDDYNIHHHSNGVLESRWKLNDEVTSPYREHDKFQFSNKIYLGNSVGNYLIIDDKNITQIDHEKRAKVKEMMVHAWEKYKLYAWGKNELKPTSKRPYTGSIFGTSDLGATIVDALDTLYLMNLANEFNEGRDWIARRFTLENVRHYNPVYRVRVQNIRQLLKDIEKPKGLYPNYLNLKTGKWGQQPTSPGALGDSFYEYLLKSWLQSDQTDDEAREMYDEAMTTIMKHMIATSPNGLIYTSDMKFDRLEHKMDHLACFSGGLLALGAQTVQNENTKKYMEIGAGITNACHETYTRTPTDLGPEAFRFSDGAQAKALKAQEKYYILRSETFESYFIMWRLTHDQKYRDWSWDAVRAPEKHCRTPTGYCGLKNVYLEEPQKGDVQQSFFLAETLKYFYLLFSDDSLLPLDEWVVNTGAHPLPIRGANQLYRLASSSVSLP